MNFIIWNIIRNAELLNDSHVNCNVYGGSKKEMEKIEGKIFKEGLIEEDLTKIKKVSKGDVHSHCGLGMRFSTFNKWAGGNVNKPPKKMDGIKGLDDYIFNETMKYISKKEDIGFLIEETVKEAINDGVKVLGTSID